MEKPKFKVIIVGGSITGLTLANCLERAGIDYVVLERHGNIGARIGAGVGILPNSGRVLEQLGLFDAVEKEIEPISKAHTCFPDGSSFTSDYPAVLTKRFGFPIAFLDRKKILDILYTALKDQSKVHVNKEVVKVEQLKAGMRVLTADGCFYDGDLVVGADGVHSKVRSEMWRIAESQQPGLITEKEKNNMCAEYSCLFGTSSAVPGLEKPGQQVTCWYDGATIMTLTSREGRIIWFFVQKMDKKYYYPDVPRFTKEDAIVASQSHQHMQVWKGVTWGDIMDRVEACSLTALVENLFQTWNFGRIVCLGDSMHQMTPNMAQGANSAIESAVVLSNALHDMIAVKHVQKPSDVELGELLHAFNQSRLARMTDICRTSMLITRFQARDGIIKKVLGRYLMQLAKDLPARMASKLIAGGVRLKYLQEPKRSENGWELFTHSEAGWKRPVLKASKNY